MISVARILVGGLNDGRTVRVAADRHRVYMPIPYDNGSSYFVKEGTPMVERVEFREEVYARMQFRGNGVTFEVFVLEGLGADDVFRALIQSYGNETGHEAPLMPRRTEVGRVIRFEPEV